MEELEGCNPVEYLEAGKVTQMIPQSLKQGIGLVSAGRTIFSRTALSRKSRRVTMVPQKRQHVAAAPASQTCLSSKV